MPVSSTKVRILVMNMYNNSPVFKTEDSDSEIYVR